MNNLETLVTVQHSMYKKLVAKRVKFSKGEFEANPNRLAKGNAKLDRSILIFDLLAGTKGSCKFDCASCYAKKAQVQYSPTNLYRSTNFELAKNHLEYLKWLLTKQISKSRTVKSVRIHSSGDFFSQDYVDMWKTIIELFPNIKFYAYTKTESFLNFSELKKLNNFNLINSNVTLEGKQVLNYGDNDHIENLENIGYFVCPATKKHWKGMCGKECDYCVHSNKVCFHIH